MFILTNVLRAIGLIFFAPCSFLVIAIFQYVKEEKKLDKQVVGYIAILLACISLFACCFVAANEIEYKNTTTETVVVEGVAVDANMTTVDVQENVFADEECVEKFFAIVKTTDGELVVEISSELYASIICAKAEGTTLDVTVQVSTTTQFGKTQVDYEIVKPE